MESNTMPKLKQEGRKNLRIVEYYLSDFVKVHSSIQSAINSSKEWIEFQINAIVNGRHMNTEMIQNHQNTIKKLDSENITLKELNDVCSNSVGLLGREFIVWYQLLRHSVNTDNCSVVNAPIKVSYHFPNIGKRGVIGYKYIISEDELRKYGMIPYRRIKKVKSLS